ncbi:hypothetical protein CIW52_29690 [Mycolicibacterium sp. P9-64]|uniref:hypothetical protein n=1 Tax=Mycolicibacterium sp. P9-64 TaxID=2024612 RepID=UPI0011EF37BA|nr:hypothetical protein [Mycolicibacterium sp. P9-64]KAA0079188.1 hypothetical protein CIW52_29690 [Mycolicibacterium sp. P9-64]
MTASTDVGPLRAGQKMAAWYYGLHPGYRLALRWGLIVSTTAVAFHNSIISLVQTTAGGGLGGFVWTVVVVGTLVAIGVARWNRTELPIHDRQTDVIVGTMGLVLALLIHGVLLARYALYFHLLRLDLVAMWLFVLSASIVLFGLRPVTRFAWVWGMVLVLTFPLPYYVTVVALGGGRVAAGAATLLVSGVGTGIALGRTIRRGFIGSVVSWVFGGLLLLIMAVYFPDAPLLAFQLIPAVATMCVVGGGFFLLARIGAPKHVLDRKVEPLAARQVWAGVPVVVVVGVALAFVHLPPAVGVTPVAPVHAAGLRQGRALIVPPGWHMVSEQTYDWVHRLHGRGGDLIRQQVTADAVNPAWDRLGRTRTVMVDSVTSTRPFSFNVFPARVLYDVTGARLSEPRFVDLGLGVKGQMVSVVDDHLLVTWNALQFSWGDRDIAQRVILFAVDNHDPGAPFPEPSAGVAPTLGTLFTILLRGNAAATDRLPTFKDAELLTQFGRALVAAQGIAVGDAR